MCWVIFLFFFSCGLLVYGLEVWRESRGIGSVGVEGFGGGAGGVGGWG